jgi:hypothetical protein
VISGLAQSIPQAGAAIRQGLRMQMGDALEALGLVKRDPVYLADQQRKLAQAVGASDFTRPNFESSTAAGVYGGAESFLRAIPGVAASVALRSPTPAMIAIGGQTQAEAYGKYRARGGTPGESFAGAAGEALVEIATEYLPGKYLAESLGKTGAKEFILNFIKKDALGEQAATILQDAIDTAIANPDKTWEQYLVERPDAAYRTLVATITQAGLMGGVNTALRRVAEMGDKQGEATQTSQALGAALKGAQASALLKRDPAQFREVMNALSEDGVVYVDAQVLNQMPPDVLAQMEGVQAELPDALATSSPVAVKVADILTLDRVQKKLPLDEASLRRLRAAGMVEGRRPNVHVSAAIANATERKVQYIRTRKQDDAFYIKLVSDYLGQFGSASRQEINDLLWDKLSEGLDSTQREYKIGNLLGRMRRSGLIQNQGARKSARWSLNLENLEKVPARTNKKRQVVDK